MKAIRELLVGRTTPLTRPGSISALDAARAMQDVGVGALLVTDGSGRLAGIFTERDLMVRIVVAGREAARTPVSEVMTRQIYFCAPDQRIGEVARELQNRHVRHLPVVENGRIVGLLSLRDLLREYLQDARHQVDELTAYIQGEGEQRASSL
jgi:CBS domain-containing protein